MNKTFTGFQKTEANVAENAKKLIKMSTSIREFCP